MADKPNSYGFGTGQFGYIDSDGKEVPLRSFRFGLPLGWAVISEYSVQSIIWPFRSRFSRKVQHSIARREARTRKKGQSNG